MARPAARVTDNHVCPLITPPATPHVGGPVLPPGAPHTLINGMFAARVNDKALCVAPAMDTVRGGLITVFVEGSPASRLLDKTDVGTIVVGSPTVLLGEWGGGPLTPFQAQWLYNYMAQQNEIPFAFATDGCYARADRMDEYMKSLGIDPGKAWVGTRDGSPGLFVPINGYPQSVPNADGSAMTPGVRWWYHVAPTVQVQQPDGSSAPMVIDPSLNFGKPVSVNDWVGKMNVSPNDPNIWQDPTDPSVYWPRYNPRTRTFGRGVSATDAEKQRFLEDRRKDRAALLHVAPGPVHY